MDARRIMTNQAKHHPRTIGGGRTHGCSLDNSFRFSVHLTTVMLNRGRTDRVCPGAAVTDDRRLGGLTQQEFYYPTVLEASSLKSEGPRGCVPSKAMGEDPSRPLIAPGGSGVPWLLAPSPQSLPRLYTAFFPSLFSSVSYKNTCQWI